jgi:hypothetical protein
MAQPLEKNTVAIPVVRGVELRTAARLVPATSLLEAINSRLSGGSKKRFGHLAYRIRSGQYPLSSQRPDLDDPVLTDYGAKVLDSAWLLGWGVLSSASRSDGTDGATFSTSEYPEAGHTFGITGRDDELLTWNGHSLFSHADSQDDEGRHGKLDPAMFPAMRATQVAKSSLPQTSPDVADNGTNRMVVWLDNGATPQVRYSIYDSVRGAPLVVEGAIDFMDP